MKKIIALIIVESLILSAFGASVVLSGEVRQGEVGLSSSDLLMQDDCGNITLSVESNGDVTEIDFDINGFCIEKVLIDNEEYFRILIGDESNIMVKGSPDLPNICRSLIIPDNAKMSVEVIDIEYQDYEDVLIAPSKGILPRTIDPADVPYMFGDVYYENGWFPGEVAELDEPYILRDFRGQVVKVNPFQYNPLSKILRVYSEITIKIFPIGDGEINVYDRTGSLTSIDLDFKSIYENHFVNFNSDSNKDRYAFVGEQGNMLVICYDDFYDEMIPFVNWKNMKGIPTEIINLSDIGTTASDIDTYIETYYNTNGLTFVLLVGDIDQIPTLYYGSHGSDPSFSYIIGDDNYQDIFIGRFSAQDTSQLETQVERSIEYEKYPQNGVDWYHKGIGIGSPEGIGDDNEYDWEHIRNIRTDLLGFTYSWVDEFYGGSQGGNDANGPPSSTDISNALNEGRSLLNYCGHGAYDGIGWSAAPGWYVFDNSDVNTLSNDNMLPFIVLVACNSGEFEHYDSCFAETLMRATNGGEPTGAIGVFASTQSQSWDPPMDAQDEICDLLVFETYYSWGGLCYSGTMHMMDEYGSSCYDETNTWTVFGDPSLQVRTDTPVTMIVQHDAGIMPGSSGFEVVVTGIENALCAISHNGELLGYAYTDANGEATIEFDDPLEDMESVDFVVTAFNKDTYITTLELVPPLRQPAEFEPMEGVLIRYPFGISYDIISEMSEDCEVVTIVANSCQQSTVLSAYTSHGVDTSNCSFLIAPSDSWWTRDYGPWFIYNDTSTEMEVVDFEYNREERPNDNAIPLAYATNQGLEYTYMDIIHTGGNYMADGHGIAVSTELVYSENPGLTTEDIDQIVADNLGIHTYHVYPDPLGEYIEHIDCWAKFLAPDVIMIIEVSPSHSYYDDIEDAATYFENQLSCFGIPYQVERVYAHMEEPYINSLILNDKVFVPITGSSWDDDAIAAYEAAMPGYEIIGFTGSWENTDAIHCRARGIPDRDVLYIEHTPLTDNSPCDGNGFLVRAKVTPYSGSDLVDGFPLLHWKTDTEGWSTIPMDFAGGNSYYAYIPPQQGGETIYYYIHAEDDSGRVEYHPYMGVLNPHSFIFGFEPVLSFNPVSHDFGSMFTGETVNTTFEIWNSGTSTMVYSLSESCNWVEVFPTSGISTGEHDTVTVDIDTTGLSGGIHQCDIDIVSNGGNDVFTIYINIFDGDLDQEQTTYEYNYAIFGSRYGAQSFKPTLDTLTLARLYVSRSESPSSDLMVSIRDSLTGSDLTSVSVPPDSIPTSSDWVSFDIPDLSVTPGSTYYIVMYTIGGSYSQCYNVGFAGGDQYPDGSLRYSSNSGSTWGEYSVYDFTFKTYGGGGAPPTPVLSISPTSHDFGNMLEGLTDSTTFDIWNSGGGTLTYSLSETCSWVDISSTGGTSDGEHDTITVDIDTTGLSETSYTCDIDITSDGGSDTFTVDVNVIPPSPILTISPTSHDFGNMLEGITDSTTFDIWNSGGGTLTYSLSETCSWVDISSTGGTSDGEHDTITVDIDTTGLSETSYTCDIDVTSDGGSDTFTVDVNVVAGGTEELDQEQTAYAYDFAIYSTRHGAQSFKPGLDSLTRVELYVSKAGSPTSDLVIAIRDSLTGSDLASVSVPPGSIPTSSDWVSFDIPDLSVTPGSTYYIVMYTSGGSYSQCYNVGFAGGDQYPDGSLRYSSNSGSSWAEYSVYDFTFKTYGGGGAPPTPVLSISPTSHDFGNMLEGLTDSTTFDIWNSGGGTLTYSLSETCSWVDISSTGGTSDGEHDTITVDIDTTGLSETSYTCDIDITSDGGSDTFTVDVNVIPPSPILTISPTSHDFGNMLEGITDSTTFDIWNSGTGTLTYSLSETCSWVDISSTGGTSDGEHDTITVDIDTTGLSETSYTCDIDVTSDGGSDTFTVDVNVVAGGTEELDQEQTAYTYDFAIYSSRHGAQSFKPGLDSLTRVELYVSKSGSPTSDLVVAIRDSLTGSDLTSVSVPAGSIPTSSDWVSFDIPDLSVTPGSTYYIVMYTSGGSYSQCYNMGFAGGNPYADGSLRYSSNGGSSWAEYSVYDFTFRTYGGGGAPPTPVLSINPTSHDFGNMLEGLTDSTTFDIWNSGGGTLTYSLSETCSWVDISSTGGTSSGEHDTITVDIDTTGLSETSYSCDIDVTSDGGSDTFTVDVNVIPPSPILSISPTSHDFGNMLEGLTDSTTFDIWNSGSGTLIYSLSETCSWVEISSAGGTSDGEHDTITVDIDTTGLSETSYTCDIDVTSDGGSDTFTVDVTVIPPSPILTINPTSHDFGNMLEGITDSTTFDIWNSGSGTLIYSLSETCSWVEISSAGGTSDGEHDTITVDIDTTGLSETSYTCDIDVTSDGGSDTFTVDVNVVAGGNEELDQEQTEYVYDFAIYGSRHGGQSFKPTLDSLTRVELYVSKSGSPTSDLVIAIRDSLTGSDLASVSVPPGSIPTSSDWVSFDIVDLTVTPGSTYYIVMYTAGGSYSQCYNVGFAGSNPYADGSLRYSSNSGSSWMEYSVYDFTFRTYGSSS